MWGEKTGVTRDKNVTALKQRDVALEIALVFFWCLDKNSNVEGDEKNSVALSLLQGDYMYMLEIMTVIGNNW